MLEDKQQSGGLVLGIFVTLEIDVVLLAVGVFIFNLTYAQQM